MISRLTVIAAALTSMGCIHPTPRETPAAAHPEIEVGRPPSSIVSDARTTAVTSRASAAQTRTSIAVDAALGGGFGKGGEFFDRQIAGARFGVGIRTLRSSHFGLFAEGSMDWLAWSMGHYAVCYRNPRGGCLDPYPEFSGPTLVAGVVAARPDGRFEARAGLGGAAYGAAEGPRVGAAIGQLDAAAFPLRHVGLVLGARWIVIPRYRGDRLSVVPWMFGVRIH